MTEVVPELTNGEFEEFIKEGTVLIDFFAEWCMPCVMMAPIVEDLKEEYKEKVKIGKVHIEENPHLTKKYEIQSIPHFIIFKDGKVVEEFIGSRTQLEIAEVLEKYI